MKQYSIIQKIKFFIFILVSISCNVFAQEALKSTEEEYYDFLSLNGLVERPTLGYRTLSDSEWNINVVNDEEPIWSQINLGNKYTLFSLSSSHSNWFLNGVNQSINMKIYGPEWFNSYNTAAPYGQNDGVLWQGKGYNTSLTTGIRFEGYGLELTLKPQLVFTENRRFEYIKPNYSGENYKGKAEDYGYYGVKNIDAPQRFGNKSFWDYSWGDTEVRLSFYNFTAGFGWQSIWLGPSKINPLLHSNNAPSYPKFDIGLRKTQLTMPYFGWDLGQIEFRGWWGKLSESSFFDNIEHNDNNLISGLSFSWQLPFLKKLTIGFNRIMLSKWSDFSAYTLFNIYVPGLSNSGGTDSSDQRASITVDYLLEKVGFETYFEWARNDYSPTKEHYIRYPFHTQAWTLGFIKSVNLPLGLKGKLNLEFTHLENSADYDRLMTSYTTFYAHHKITQGHTNCGQWLGAGIGTGGNSQLIQFEVFYSLGNISLFLQRNNPDLDYTMYIDSKKDDKSYGEKEASIRTKLNFGIEWNHYFFNNLSIELSYVFTYELQHLNQPNQSRNNNYISLNVKYDF